MANYGTHTYNTTLQSWLKLDADRQEIGLEWEVSITVTCTSPYQPAQVYGPPEDCYPAEGPEFEFDSFEFFAGNKMILRSEKWSVGEALFGENIWNHLYDDAVINAEENPDD